MTVLAATLLASCAHAPRTDTPAGLPGTSWRAESIEGEGVVRDSNSTLTFDSEGGVSGSTSCSDYTGVSTIQGERLAFSTLSVRYGDCSSKLKSQEQRFLKATVYVRRYRIDSDGKLHLLDEDGKERMRLQLATPAAPGSTP